MDEQTEVSWRVTVAATPATRDFERFFWCFIEYFKLRFLRSGKSATMRSYSGGMQIHAFGDFKSEYKIKAPFSGNYLLTAKVATAQTGQEFLFTVNDGQTVEQAAPYTIGLWKTTEAVPVTLKSGANTLHFEIAAGSRGVTIKELTLTPAN